jgi:hypothetical protein
MRVKRFVCIALVCVTTSQVATAQFVSARIAVAAVGEWRPSVQGGLEVRGEIGAPSSHVDSMGVTHRTPPKLLWSTMGLAGVSFARADNASSAPRATAQAQAGVLYRLSGAARVGVYGVGFIGAMHGLGALARYEPSPPVALQAGWVHERGRLGDVAMLQLDIAASFLTDLFRGGGR